MAGMMMDMRDQPATTSQAYHPSSSTGSLDLMRHSHHCVSAINTPVDVEMQDAV
jgi:hypothetical protein